MGFLDIVFNRTRTVGLDIGSSSVKIVELLHSKHGYRLKAISMLDMPENTIIDKEIANREVLLDTLEALVKDTEKMYRGKIKDVVFAVSRSASKAIFIDRIEKENIPRGEDPTDYISSLTQNRSYGSEGEETTFDYKILKRERREDSDQDIADILIVTVRDDVVSPYVNVLQDIGLNPVIFDIDVFAVYNCWYTQRLPEDFEQVQVILHIGEYNTAVILVDRGVFHSSRNIAIGTNSFMLSLQSHMKTDRVSAISLLKGEIPSDISEESVDKVLFYTAEEFSSYLESTFRYFSSEVLKGTKEVSKLILSGGGATIHGFNTYLEKKFNIPVMVLNPFEGVEVDSGMDIDFDAMKGILPIFSVAMGLALRKTEEV